MPVSKAAQRVCGIGASPAVAAGLVLGWANIDKVEMPERTVSGGNSHARHVRPNMPIAERLCLGSGRVSSLVALVVSQAAPAGRRGAVPDPHLETRRTCRQL